MSYKVTETQLKQQVIVQFGSQKALADKLGISESQLSQALKRQSPRFIARLKKAGLKVDDIFLSDVEKSTTELQDMISTLKQRITILEANMKEQDNIIEQQNLLLENYKALLGKQKSTKRGK